MRCVACNRILTDFESTRKYTNSERYVDLCNHCFSSISDQLPVLERPDLMHEDTTEEAYEDDYVFREYQE